jgi:hypothetical protein
LDLEKTYQCLEEVADKLGISIRYEDLSSSEVVPSGGLCRVKGRYFFIMDTSKDLTQRIGALSQCLAQMNLDGIYVMPAVRALLERSDEEG